MYSLLLSHGSLVDSRPNKAQHLGKTFLSYETEEQTW